MNTALELQILGAFGDCGRCPVFGVATLSTSWSERYCETCAGFARNPDHPHHERLRALAAAAAAREPRRNGPPCPTHVTFHP